MADRPPDVEPGQRPSAAGHNAVTEAAFREFPATRPSDHEAYPEPYAKCQSDWEENAGDPKVSVKYCDADGSNVRGTAFDVYLPRRRTEAEDIDANAYEDDIIRWAYDYAGRPILVSIPPVGRVFGKLDGILEAGGSQTLSVWDGAPLADSGENVTVYDWFLEAAAEMASGTKCKAVWYCGRWYADAAECPAA